ncbi:MAG: hypothetical protein GPJ54_15880 [Candidatus Heimdallarchaeota archaeon]|nr:hypothetical protein [Candidatus Heimdallarchaeota archaeon]
MKTPYQNLFLIVLIITGIPFFISGNSNDSDINNLNQIKNNTYDFAVPDQTSENPGVFKLVNFNIIAAQDTPRNNWSEILVDENAEVLTLVETGRWKLSDGSFDKAVEELNALFPNEKPYEAVTFEPDGTTDGQAIFSRFPIIESYSVPEFPLDDGTIYQLSHPLIVAVLDIDGQEIIVVSEHNSCCQLTDVRSDEQEAINNYFDSLGPAVAIIYSGDFNNVPPEHDIRDPEQPQDWDSDNVDMLLNGTHPKATIYHTWTDTYRELNPDIYQYTGYSAENDNGFLERIDYILVNQNLVDNLVSSVVKLRGFDHGHVTNIFNLNPDKVNLRPPLPPVGISINVDVTNQQSTISWNENVEDDFFKYQLWRNKCLITELPSGQTSFADNYFYDTNKIYNYEMRAIDIFNNISPLSSYNYINSSLGNLSLPGQPVIAASTVSGGVQIIWSEPDTGNTTITQYEIYRTTIKGYPLNPFVKTQTANYTDTSISKAGITLYYQVRAYNLIGQGPFSVVATAPSGLVTSNSIQISSLSPNLLSEIQLSQDDSGNCPETITTLEYTPPPTTTSTPSTSTSTTTTTTSSDSSTSTEDDSVFGLPIFSLVLVNLAVIILRKRKD